MKNNLKKFLACAVAGCISVSSFSNKNFASAVQKEVTSILEDKYTDLREAIEKFDGEKYEELAAKVEEIPEDDQRTLFRVTWGKSKFWERYLDNHEAEREDFMSQPHYLASFKLLYSMFKSHIEGCRTMFGMELVIGDLLTSPYFNSLKREIRAILSMPTYMYDGIYETYEYTDEIISKWKSKQPEGWMFDFLIERLKGDDEISLGIITQTIQDRNWLYYMPFLLEIITKSRDLSECRKVSTVLGLLLEGDKELSALDLAALFGAVNCFHYFQQFCGIQADKNTLLCAVSGGNRELIRTAYDLHVRDGLGSLERAELAAIDCDNTEALDWLYRQLGERVVVQLIIRAAKNGDNQIINRFTEIGEGEDIKAIATESLISLVDSTKENAVLIDRHFSEVIKKLLDLGADFNVQDQNHQTPLSKMLAHLKPTPYSRLYISEILETIKQFVLHGADLNVEVETKYGHSTPLVLALETFNRATTEASTRKDLMKLVQFLIGLGVDVNAQDYEGIAPIHAVFRDDHCLNEPGFENFNRSTDETITACRLLLEAGAKIDIEVEDFFHRTLLPIDVAWDSLFGIAQPSKLHSHNVFKESFEKTLKAMGLLIDYGADPSELFYKAILKLYRIGLIGEKEAVNALATLIIQHGVDINKEFSEGKTYLMLSRDMEMKTLENLFLGAGAIDPEK
jgi:ankyrin repeat protein